jgi:hypothetical protein
MASIAPAVGVPAEVGGIATSVPTAGRYTVGGTATIATPTAPTGMGRALPSGLATTAAFTVIASTIIASTIIASTIGAGAEGLPLRP